MRSKKRIGCGAAIVLLLILFGPYLVSRVRSPGRRVQRYGSVDVTNHDETIRFMVWNIAHGRGPGFDNWAEGSAAKVARVEKLAEFIRQHDPDVVVLNEVDFCSTWSGHQNQAAAIAELAGYGNRVEQRNLDFRFVYGSWKFGNAILSRLPIIGQQVVLYPPKSTREDWLAGCKRGAVCRIKAGTAEFQLIGVHFEHRDQQTRVRSAEMIASLAHQSAVPLIAAGDFNSTLPAFPHAATTANGRSAMRVLRDSGDFIMHPQTLPEPSELTFSSLDPSRVIDWVLIPKTCEFVDYQVLDSQLSDHRPLLVTVRLRP